MKKILRTGKEVTLGAIFRNTRASDAFHGTRSYLQKKKNDYGTPTLLQTCLAFLFRAIGYKVELVVYTPSPTFGVD